MKNKKIALLFCLAVVFILSVSIVSANENVSKAHTKDVKLHSKNIKDVNTAKTVSKKENNKVKFVNKTKTSKNNIDKKQITTKTDKLKTPATKSSTYDDELLSFSTPYDDLLPNTKYTFTAFVSSSYNTVNYGNVRFYINGKNIGNKKVKNGKAALTYRLPLKEKTYTAKAVYFKNNRKVMTATDSLYVYYTDEVRPDSPIDIKKGNTAKINALVLSTHGNRATSGKVVFYRNNKKIGTAKVRNGIATLNYKANDKPGVYSLTAVYYNNKNQQATKVSKKSRMWIVGPKAYGPGTSIYKLSRAPDNTENWVINSAKWVRAVKYIRGNFIDYHGLNVNHKYSYSEYTG